MTKVAEKRIVMNPADSRPTKNEKRQEARDKARALREANSKKSKRNKVLIQSSLAVGVVGVIAIVTVLILGSLRPPGPGPANMQSDGIKIGEGYQAFRTPALAADEEPTLSVENPEGIPAINIFIDYSCPACAQFEAINGPLLRTWLENGTATVEYHIISFRDAQTAGTRYATRAANSAACVAEHSPDSFFDFNELLLANQPAPPTSFELTNTQLFQVAETSGATNLEAIKECISGETFANWVAEATIRAQRTGPLPVRNAEVPLISATPTVFVNGRVLPPGGDLAAFVASLEASE
jgi:protein-disulfide isomerase